MLKVIRKIIPTSTNLLIKKKKCYCRPEAINLLSDIAYRNKKHHPAGHDSSGSSFRSNTTSPRRLRRGTKPNSGNTSQSETNKTDSDSKFFPLSYICDQRILITLYFQSTGFNYPKYIVSSQTASVYSDSEASTTSTLSQGSFLVQQQQQHQQHSSIIDNSLRNKNCTITEEQHRLNQHTSSDDTRSGGDNESEFYAEDELWKIVDDGDCVDGQSRPNFLDLASNFGNTPVVSRKPTFQFTG